MLWVGFMSYLYYEILMFELEEGEEIFVIEWICFMDEILIVFECFCWLVLIGKILEKVDLNDVKFYEIFENNGVNLKWVKDKVFVINVILYEVDLLGICGGEVLLEM